MSKLQYEDIIEGETLFNQLSTFSGNDVIYLSTPYGGVTEIRENELGNFDAPYWLDNDF